MKLETIAFAELIPYAANARTHTESQVEQIAASTSEFGWTVPVLVDGGDSVIAGHERLRRRGGDVQHCAGEPGNDNHGERGLMPSSVGLVVLSVSQPVGISAEGDDLEAFEKLLSEHPSGVRSDWIIRRKHTSLSRGEEQSPTDSHRTLNGVRCRVWRHQESECIPGISTFSPTSWKIRPRLGLFRTSVFCVTTVNDQGQFTPARTVVCPIMSPPNGYCRGGSVRWSGDGGEEGVVSGILCVSQLG